MCIYFYSFLSIYLCTMHPRQALPRATCSRTGQRVALLLDTAVNWDTTRPAAALRLARIFPRRHEHLACLTAGAPPAQLNAWLLEGAEDGQAEFVRFLCSLPGVVHSDARPLRMCAAYGHARTAKILLAHTTCSAGMLTRMLDIAVSFGHAAVVKLLLDLPLAKGVDPSFGDNHAIRVAVRHCHSKIVKLLLDLPPHRGVDPAVSCNTPLREAIINDDAVTAKLLLDLPPSRGVDPRVYDAGFMRYCVSKHYMNVVLLFMERRHPKEESPGSILESAAINGHVELVRVLLCSPVLRETDIVAALQAAEETDQVEVIRLLTTHLLSNTVLRRRKARMRRTMVLVALGMAYAVFNRYW